MNRVSKAVWGLGGIILSLIGLLAWRLWRHLRITPVESEIELEFTTATPHKLSSEILMGERLPQFLFDGTGKLFYRRYYVDIHSPKMTKQELMAYIQDHPNKFAPSDMAVFQKIDHEHDRMQVGDDYYIHIIGPWNGPVRVIDETPTSFSFITLENHVEAGEIQFRILDAPDSVNTIRFEIRAWSRSRDWLVNLLYYRIPIVRIAQTRMWAYFCERVVEVSEGQKIGDIYVVTHRVDFEDVKEALQKKHDFQAWQQYFPRLERLRSANLNFDLDIREELQQHSDWRIDSYCIDLPDETVGEPVSGGSWELAKDVLLNYEFPDPTLITGIFIPDDPIEQRVMLLEAKFMGFTFHFGVRIHDVIDEIRDTDDGTARIWGYSYTTTEGHFEMGEIHFEVWKFLETGKVEFRIRSYSKTGHIDNIFYRIGFAIFGRRLQRRFARTAQTRLQQLVIKRLSHSDKAIDVPQIEKEAVTS